MAGQLVYLMGPSGSGKDTILAGIQRCLGTRALRAARVITRPADATETTAHAVSREQFQAMAERGAFAMHWQANGLHYGIPRSIDDALMHGRVVLVNGSRAYLDQARRLYPGLLPVLLDVPAAMLRTRLTARGREASGQIAARLARNHHVSVQSVCDEHDVIRIDNSGDPRIAVQALCRHVQTAWAGASAVGQGALA